MSNRLVSYYQKEINMTRREIMLQFHKEVMDNNNPHFELDWKDQTDERKEQYESEEEYETSRKEEAEYPPNGPFESTHLGDWGSDFNWDDIEDTEAGVNYKPGYNKVILALDSDSVPEFLLWAIGDCWGFHVHIPMTATTMEECDSLGDCAG
jgi:hypothetical protein